MDTALTGWLAEGTKLEVWELGRFHPAEAELARHTNQDAIRRLGQNILTLGLIQEVGAREDGQMIWGHGRWLAAKAANIPALRVRVYPASIPAAQFHLLRFSENIHRNELTGYQKYTQAMNLLETNPAWQQQDLAKHLNLDPSTITQMLAPRHCTAEWLDALKDQKVTLSDCYHAGRLDKDKQVGLLALKLSGASRETIAAAVRKARSAPAPAAARATRVNIKLASCTLTLAGQSLDLESVADCLGEALKEVRRAREQGIDVKAFNACMTAKRKGGAK